MATNRCASVLGEERQLTFGDDKAGYGQILIPEDVDTDGPNAEEFDVFVAAMQRARAAAEKGRPEDADANLITVKELGTELGLEGVDAYATSVMRMALRLYLKIEGMHHVLTAVRYADRYNIRLKC